MTRHEVAIIDSGGANIASLRFALERLGVASVLTTEPQRLREASHVILPGVGAAADAMQRLRALQLDTLIPTLTQPVLGICLGMQLLFEESDEGATHCLGILPGCARQLAASSARPVPHMGWNRLQPRAACALLQDLGPEDYVYFVHSYAVPVGPATVASCHYGEEFTAVVVHRNFHGTQFHPERSAGPGARVLRNFLALAA